LHVSTDFVFDGRLNRAYVETDLPNPINAYAKTKLAGEQLLSESGCRHCIIRLEWTYGSAGNNFVTKIVRRAKTDKIVRVVDDQIGSPTATTEVAKVICKLLPKRPEGIFHFASAGYVSRFEMAKFVFDKLAMDVNLLPCKTSDFVSAVLLEHPECFIVNLDKLTYAGNLENLVGFLDLPNHKFIKGDICDGALIVKIIDEYKIDAIINFAAESHVDRSINEPKIFIETNVTGTSTLLEAARDKKLERFIQISTDEVYGELGPEGKFTEETPLSPNSPYSASKAAADQLVAAFGHTWGVKYNITRCSNNYGPYQFPEKLIPLMINNALNDKELPVYGDGLYVRDWLYVYDHCTAIWQVLQKAPPGETYNIGGCNEKANLEVIGLILERLEKPKSLIKHVTDRPGHDRRYAIDASKIIRELNWRPSVSFEEGIEKTIDWYIQNQEWLVNVVSGGYQKYYESMYGNR